MKYIFFLFIPFLSFSQQIDKVDFIKCDATVFPKFETKSVEGTVDYVFNVLSEMDVIKIDAKDMTFSDVTINGKSVNYRNNSKEFILFEGYKKGKNKLHFSYKATPKQTMYYTGIGNQHQIWTQGQGKYTSYWFPSFDDVNEKVIFNISVGYDYRFRAISNGVLDKQDYKNTDNKTLWHYKMNNQMSSYLLMIAVGEFNHKSQLSDSGIPLEMYYQSDDLPKVDYTYKYSKSIFDYLEKEIGVNYPWKIYRQIPVEDFLYAGMENTTSTLFDQDFVVDEIGYNDRNYVNVNAHELAHQWFGDMITAKSGKHHWLQEGFATYYALQAERKIFGDDYFYYSLYKNAQQLKQAAKSDTIPVLNEKASSLSFYQKGAWALYVIHESVGDALFKKAIQNYLKKYKFKNVETSDFLNEIAAVSTFDVAKFQKEWLEDYHFQTNEVNELLQKNQFIKTLLEIQAQRTKPFADKEALFTQIMQADGFYPLKKEIIYQIKEVPFEQKQKLITLAMETKDLEARQSVAETLNPIPSEFKWDYETLLEDASYDTKQIALINLVKSFPEDRARYYEKAKNWMGKNDKELRITYLTLFQLDRETDAVKKLNYWNELVDYTTSKYESSVRENALENALVISPCDEVVLKNLVHATMHHKWQFTKFAREKIRDLLKQDCYYRELFEKIVPQLEGKEQDLLVKILQEK